MRVATIKLIILLLTLVPNNNYGLNEARKPHAISKQFNKLEYIIINSIILNKEK
jgi:hypothetical protein